MHSTDNKENPSPQRIIQIFGLIAGPVAALVVYLLLPENYRGIDGNEIDFTHAGRATLAVMAWMATWWLTEAIDISATALLPIAVFPLLGILSIGQTTAPYGSEFIFLFLGGFILALSMQRWKLDRRIALVTLRFVGAKPANVIGGFMLITAVMSMWVSNTATAAMMLPIGLSVIALVFKQLSEDGAEAVDVANATDLRGKNFALSLMLGIAYAASIGGIASIIGSPPNVILVGFLSREYGVEIGFAQWMLFGVPFAVIFLAIAWAMITWVLYPFDIDQISGGRELFRRQLKALGPVKRGEWITMIVFFGTATLWITRPLLAGIVLGSGDDVWHPFAGLSDAGIVIIAAIALFVIPVSTSPPPQRLTAAKRRWHHPVSEPIFRRLGTITFTMNWETAMKLPWGILILFGGGLSLAAAVQANGVAEFFGAQAAGLKGVPPIVLVLAVTAGVIFLTELTSNTATTATLVPVLAGLAPGVGVTPEMLIFPATIAASCAFMMPVATPPNAIVFGSGHITVEQMAKAGFWLNLIGVALVTLILYFVVIPIIGTSLTFE
jgi:solute carrier family 13 (sodium-dependent dicarboxylate transporter), member 2/3/5